MMMVAVKGWRLRWALAFSCTSPPPHHRPPVSLEFETLVLVFISKYMSVAQPPADAWGAPAVRGPQPYPRSGM